MNFKLTFIANEAYYQEAYGELIALTEFKKWEPAIGIALIIFGFVLYFIDKDNKLGPFPFIFCVLGIYAFCKFYYDKKKWLKDRLDSKILGQSIEMEFDESTIKHSGPFSNGELQWFGLKAIIKSKRGILLKPETGVSIYLSNEQFANKEQIDFIMSRKTTKHNAV